MQDGTIPCCYAELGRVEKKKNKTEITTHLENKKRELVSHLVLRKLPEFPSVSSQTCFHSPSGSLGAHSECQG